MAQVPKTITVLSGPSGVGKSTIVKCIRESFPKLVWSVSATTRPRGDNEVEGVDYYFLTEEEFDRWIVQGRFIEYARYGSYRYGTPRPDGIEGHLLIEFDIQGAVALKAIYPDALCIWINPPGVPLFDVLGLSDDVALAELKQRLERRNREGAAKILRRLAEAKREFDQLRADLTLYPVIINNHDINRAADNVRRLIRGQMAA
jgi:guanylate kinase